MAAITEPDEEELYLLAILLDDSGIDIAEFMFLNEENSHGRFRCWDYQFAWWADDAPQQIDQSGRALGKSWGVQMRACAFPFSYPDQDMLLTAPELNHLRPLVDAVEGRLLTSRIMEQMLPDTKGKGIARQPHWQVRFRNGAKIVSRLPNKDGKGVKGCLAATTNILTQRGQVPAREVVVGDQVLTHLGRWRPITWIGKSSNVDCVTVAGGGHRGLTMSYDHRMWARRNRNPQRTRKLDSPYWIVPGEDEEMERHYLASPVTFPMDGTFDTLGLNVADMWLIGRWVADGFVRRRGDSPTGLALIVSQRQLQEVHEGQRQAGRTVGKPALRENGTYQVDVCDSALAALCQEEFGQHADGKKLPVWLLGAPEAARRAFLEGYLSGDGHWDPKKKRWTASTASKALAVNLRLLGQSLGYACGFSWVDPKVTEICSQELKAAPKRSYRVTFTDSDRNRVVEDGYAWQKIRSVTEAESQDVYDFSVEEDHSFIADGLVSHNQHVIKLEIDEAQDYPLAGWIEVVETLNRGSVGAQWRIHGVSRGVRDKFYEFSQSPGWVVHRKMAMNRPSWTPQERDEKVITYGGSRQNPDYKRNIYGEHGDATNPLFVLARLMDCVDQNAGSEYNADVYAEVRITFEELQGRHPLMLIDGKLPGSHRAGWTLSPKGYSAYYAGMDVGATNHPSEILVFGQRAGTQKEQLDCLTRVHMQRISMDDQELIVDEIFRFYGEKLITFSIDRTGVGFPLWERLAKKYGERLKGYNFSGKYAVALEDRPLEDKEELEDLVIERNIVEFSSDALREVVDSKGFLLPFDRELLTEWQGQSYVIVKSKAGPYGTKRQYSDGSFHTLDAGKMMIAGKRLHALDEMLNAKAQQGPVIDVFLGAY